ncbi:MAG: RNA-binding domain-containing protein [Candidatus Bathyarchaeia archaeon]
MSSKTPIAYVDVRVFAHATEDPEKVQTAVRNTLPTELAENLVFTKNSLTGHHGNPILIMEAKLTERKALPAVLQKIAAELGSLDKERLSAEMKQHIEKRNLYLRLDKQAAFLGKIRLSTNDPIHFKIHFKNKTAEEIINLCREAGLLP